MMRFPTGKLESLSLPKKDRWVFVLLLLFGFFFLSRNQPHLSLSAEGLDTDPIILRLWSGRRGVKGHSPNRDSNSQPVDPSRSYLCSTYRQPNIKTHYTMYELPPTLAATLCTCGPTQLQVHSLHREHHICFRPIQWHIADPSMLLSTLTVLLNCCSYGR